MATETERSLPARRKTWPETGVGRGAGRSAWSLKRFGLNSHHQEPTAWDFWFRKGLRSHVRVVFADGRSVWGFYGRESFASYAKDGRDVFLDHLYDERTVQDDDDSDERAGPWFGTAHAANRGGWVNLDGAVCVEIYAFRDEHTSAKPTGAARWWPSARSGRGSAADQPPSEQVSDAAGAAASAEEGVKRG